MNKIQKIFFFGVLFVVALMVYAEATKPPQVSWFQSFYHKDKIPYGTYVLTDLLKKELEEHFIEVNRAPYEVLLDSTLAGTYFFVNGQVNFDDTELDALMDWVDQGNNVFISAHYHGSNLLDSLQIETKIAFSFSDLNTEPMLNLVHEDLKSDTPIHIEKDLAVPLFDKIDTLSQTVLGVAQLYNDTLTINKPQPNFLKAPFGKGTFYLHNQPEIFSNYFLLLKDNIVHTENVLSYVNNGSNLYYDTYYKNGKPINISPLYILLNNQYLKWAYYMVLIGTVLFIFFQGKRKQRSIPIVEPLTNKSYQYTRTIAGMYLDKRDFHGIAQKQIVLFLEYIRTQLRLPTEQIDSRFMKSLSARSNNEYETTISLFTFIEKIQHQANTGELELVKLNKLITEYKSTIDGKS